MFVYFYFKDAYLKGYITGKMKYKESDYNFPWQMMYLLIIIYFVGRYLIFINIDFYAYFTLNSFWFLFIVAKSKILKLVIYVIKSNIYLDMYTNFRLNIYIYINLFNFSNLNNVKIIKLIIIFKHNI